jgi:SM-20-related protein
MTVFALNQELDLDALRGAFAREGRIQVVDFLRHDTAMALLRALVESRAWRLAVNSGQQTNDHDPAEVEAWPAERRAALERQVVEGGRNGFQFRYDTIRLPEYGATAGGGEAPPAVRDFVDFLSGGPALDFLRALTGMDDIAFADGHATRYRPGHFLTAHDDLNQGMGRRAAYVMNVTPQWRPDWGGILQFYDERGNVERGFIPAFNVLNVFRVPQPHSVTWVTPFAGAPRHAVTGWLRVAAD